MFNLEVGFYICNTTGFLRIMYLIKVLLNLIRFAVPIILILMVALDLFKNVINPKEKEGMKKIVNRIIAAVIVFFVPTVVSLVLYLMDYVLDNKSEDYKVSSCYTNANTTCINKVDNYLDCGDIYPKNLRSSLSNEEKEKLKNCKEYRRCNDYTLTSSCGVVTVEKKGICKRINEKVGFNYRRFGN